MADCEEFVKYMPPSFLPIRGSMDSQAKADVDNNFRLAFDTMNSLADLIKALDAKIEAYKAGRRP